MSVRKVRFSWISDSMHGTGAQINLSFEGELLETGLEIESTNVNDPIVKEYEFDLDPGTYNFVLEYTNDQAADLNRDGELDVDRNLKIVKIEVANDGINYENITGTYHDYYFNTTGVNLDSHDAVDYERFDSTLISGIIIFKNDSYTLPISFQ